MDAIASPLHPPSAKLSLKVKSCKLAVISGVRIPRCIDVERKDLDTARYAKSFSLSKCIPLDIE